MIANCIKMTRLVSPPAHPNPMAVTEQDVLAALSELIDPVTGRNFVESKAVKNVKIEGERLSLDVALGYPARGVLEKVRHQVSERLAKLPGVAHASVNVYSKVVAHAVQLSGTTAGAIARHCCDRALGASGHRREPLRSAPRSPPTPIRDDPPRTARAATPG